MSTPQVNTELVKEAKKKFEAAKKATASAVKSAQATQIVKTGYASLDNFMASQADSLILAATSAKLEENAARIGVKVAQQGGKTNPEDLKVLKEIRKDIALVAKYAEIEARDNTIVDKNEQEDLARSTADASDRQVKLLAEIEAETDPEESDRLNKMLAAVNEQLEENNKKSKKFESLKQGGIKGVAANLVNKAKNGALDMIKGGLPMAGDLIDLYQENKQDSRTNRMNGKEGKSYTGALLDTIDSNTGGNLAAFRGEKSPAIAVPASLAGTVAVPASSAEQAMPTAVPSATISPDIIAGITEALEGATAELKDMVDRGELDQSVMEEIKSAMYEVATNTEEIEKAIRETAEKTSEKLSESSSVEQTITSRQKPTKNARQEKKASKKAAAQVSRGAKATLGPVASAIPSPAPTTEASSSIMGGVMELASTAIETAGAVAVAKKIGMKALRFAGPAGAVLGAGAAGYAAGTALYENSETVRNGAGGIMEGLLGHIDTPEELEAKRIASPEYKASQERSVRKKAERAEKEKQAKLEPTDPANSTAAEIINREAEASKAAAAKQNTTAQTTPQPAPIVNVSPTPVTVIGPATSVNPDRTINAMNGRTALSGRV